jgi:hypothetical protein
MNKQLVQVIIEAGASLIAAYLMLPVEERDEMQLRMLRVIAHGAHLVAEQFGTVALRAERAYYERVNS